MMRLKSLLKMLHSLRAEQGRSDGRTPRVALAKDSGLEKRVRARDNT